MRNALFSLAVSFAASTCWAAATVSTFTGGDPGEGLDLQGTFVAAVHAAPDSNVYTVGNATFVARNLSPNTTWGGNSETPFGSPNYGATQNDINLAAVNDYVKFDSGSPGTLPVQINGLVAGQLYQLQLLYNEACCGRAFDVFINGNLEASNLNPGALQGGGPPFNQSVGVVFTGTYAADTNGLISIVEVGHVGAADQNPIIDALTLKAVPEPSTLALAGLGLVGLFVIGRRRFVG